jgi:hypothetical protein
MSDSLPFLGRCRECDYALFTTAEDVKQAESLREVKAGTGAYRVNNGVVGRCPAGHKVFPLRQIEGTFSADHNCDARCLNARGHTCTCSCGGMNHGRGHVATVVVEAGHEPQFLGEVGKYIKGTATVTREADERRPFTFTTDKGDVITWWLPDFIENPGYKQGQRVTFRAKVKDHKTFMDTKQTVVTYFEEIEV